MARRTRSIGARGWRPDIRRGAGVVAALLRPGGRLFLREGHPMMWTIDDGRTDDLVVGYPYFEQREPTAFDEPGTYVETAVEFGNNATRDWSHGIGEIVTALLDAGMELTMLVEHDTVPWEALPGRMRRDGPEDEAIVAYCREVQAELAKGSALGEPIRALLDLKPVKATTKRWGWVKKGAPVVIEVGGRDVAGGNVSVIRRDELYRADGKLDSRVMPRGELVAGAGALLETIQAGLHRQSVENVRANIVPLSDWAAVEASFAAGQKNPGWVDVAWSKPTGAALEAVVERLKALKLTIRNAPRGQTGQPDAPCIFTGEPAVERVLIGRAY